MLKGQKAKLIMWLSVLFVRGKVRLSTRKEVTNLTLVQKRFRRLLVLSAEVGKFMNFCLWMDGKSSKPLNVNIRSTESDKEWDDINLQELNWADYDENGVNLSFNKKDCSVGIYNFESKITRSGK